MNKTEPQLSEEMEKKFDEQYLPLNKYDGGDVSDIEIELNKQGEDFKIFLATALEEQRKEYIKKLKLQREYRDFGHQGDNPHLNGYLDGLDFAIYILNGKEKQNG